MKNKWIGIASAAAFLALLGIVGAIEHGAPLCLVWGASPALAVLGVCAKFACMKR